MCGRLSEWRTQWIATYGILWAKLSRRWIPACICQVWLRTPIRSPRQRKIWRKFGLVGLFRYNFWLVNGQQRRLLAGKGVVSSRDWRMLEIFAFIALLLLFIRQCVGRSPPIAVRVEIAFYIDRSDKYRETTLLDRFIEACKQWPDEAVRGKYRHHFGASPAFDRPTGLPNYGRCALKL